MATDTPGASLKAEAKLRRRLITSLLLNDSKRYDVLRDQVEQYIEFQHAADVVAGAAQHAAQR